MNKIKIAKKMGTTNIVIKSLKGQQLNENEIYAINSNKVDGLLHLEVIQKGSSFKLYYNITGFITFREFLRDTLNKEKFAKILQNILANLKSMECSYFNQRYLLMDFNMVMVNPATQRIHFVYVPIQLFESGSTLRNFLLNIIQYASFAPYEDNTYIKDYINILNSGINFSVFELEEYINKLLGNKTSRNENIECPHCHTMLKKGTNYCSTCGAKVSGMTGGTSKGVYDPLKNVSNIEVDDNDYLDPPSQPSKASTQGLSSGTTVLGADPGGTTVLGSEELYKPRLPYLIRKKNGEKIPINKPSFRIGKDPRNSDYVVFDNNAVSRKHADIIIRDERYYVVDLLSTNKTFIDERVIPTKQEVEIFSGAKLRFADEDFDFYID